MRYHNVHHYLRAERRALRACRAAAVVLAEDEVELASSIAHLQRLGFDAVILLALPTLEFDDPQVYRIDYDVFGQDALLSAVNALIGAAPGVWLHYCYSAEYLFYPFCESRNIHELIAFHESEGRRAFLTYVIDLYAGQLAHAPNGVSLHDAYLDAGGYYALPRKDPGRDYALKERQIDCFGGLRWRYEEHVFWAKRRIDRIGLFKSTRRARLLADHTFSDEEMNTYACPHHSNVTAAIASFRTAKAMRLNPGPHEAISDFRWQNSVAFSWNSQQLMDLGLMEPGQWF